MLRAVLSSNSIKATLQKNCFRLHGCQQPVRNIGFSFGRISKEILKQESQHLAKLPNKYGFYFTSWLSRLTKKDLLKAGFILSGCGVYLYLQSERVPFTNRLRFNIIPSLFAKSFVAFTDLQLIDSFGKMELPHTRKEYRIVEMVGTQLTRRNDLDSLEYHVVLSNEKNAMVSQGGQVFVFTGLLSILQSHDELAIILAHELSHKLASHVLDSLVFQFIVHAFQVFLDDQSTFLDNFAKLALSLPFSRKNEIEADYMGLMIAAEAGYDPRSALKVWTKMAEVRGTSIDNEVNIHSTHPTDGQRIHNFRPDGPWMKEAMKRYEIAKQKWKK